MIDRSKLEQFIKNMGNNKYLATIFLIKRVTELQDRTAKLIPGSQRFMLEQTIDEFLEGKSKAIMQVSQLDEIESNQKEKEEVHPE